MKPQLAHTHEDRLLELAYGELEQPEARVVKQHVQGCARCARALAEIRGVRTVMARLPMEPAPQEGLESLLAYAQQSARRAAAGPAPASRWWRSWLAPALGLASVTFFGLIAYRVNEQTDLKPELPPKLVAAEPARNEASTPPPPAAVAATTPAPGAAPEPTAAAAAPEEVSAKPYREPPQTKAKRAKDAIKQEWSNSGAGFRDKKAPDARSSRVPTDDDLFATTPAQADEVAPPSPAPEPQAPLQVQPSSERGRASHAYRGPEQRQDAAAGSMAGSEQRQMAQLESMAAQGATQAGPAELSRQASGARRAGDRAREAALLRLALNSGASGAERGDLLGRLCEAELALDHREAALSTCRQLLQEAPDSRTAGMARKFLEREAASAASKAAEPQSSPVKR